MSNPWAFRINYERAIQADLCELAHLSSPQFVALCALRDSIPVENRQYLHQALDLMLYRPTEVAAIVGLDTDEMRALSVALNTFDERLPGDFGPAQPGDYQRGHEIAERLAESYWMTINSEATRLADLKKAKSALSRHRRNAQKYPGK